MPPTKARSLRQGSKKPLLEEDPKAADKVASVPDESKSPGLLPGSAAALLLPRLGTEKRSQCRRESSGRQAAMLRPLGLRGCQTPTPRSERSRAAPAWRACDRAPAFSPPPPDAPVRGKRNPLPRS